MDRFSYLPMGRRRPWIIAAQGGLLLSVCLLGLIPDPGNNIVLLTWIAFLINSFAAVQDVAVDGMAIDVLPERGKANAFAGFGQVVGSVVRQLLAMAQLISVLLVPQHS